MILSDRSIRARLSHYDPARRLVIDGMKDPEQQIQAASVDVHVGNKFIIYRRGEQGQLEVSHATWIEDGQMLWMQPGDFILATTKERVSIPPDLTCRVDGKSSLGRLGLLVHVTAGNVDPGFGLARDYISEPCEVTLEIASVFPVPVPIMAGMPIAQLVFTQMDQPAERPYGWNRNSHYTRQSGPQPSRFLKGDYFIYDKP